MTVRTITPVEDGDTTKPLVFDQPRDQLQFTMIIGHLVDVQPVDILGLPLLQSRS